MALGVSALTLAALAALSAAGCGGSTPAGASGSPSASYGGAGRGQNPGDIGAATGGAAAGAPLDAKAAAALPKSRLGLFLTATTPPTGGFAHAWATVVRVELLDAADKPVTVFDSPEGVTVDLAGLHDSSGPRFAPLASAPVAGGATYTRARVTFARAWTLFAPGASVGEASPLADSVSRDAEGRPTLSFPLNKPRDLGTGKESLVIDVDLTRTAFANGQVVPALRESDPARAADPARQEALLLTGTVAEIAVAPDGTATFLLAGADGRSAYVQAGPTAAVFHDGPADSPKLVEGARVQARGYLAADTKRLVAASVKVYGAGVGEEATPASTLAGPVVRADAAGGTLVLTPAQVAGLVPTQGAVTVTVAKDAVLRSRGGLTLAPEAFWEAAAARGARVRVEGAYEPVTGALMATRARLEDAAPVAAESREADVTALTSAADADAKTLTLSAPLLAWDGLLAPAGDGKGGASLPVAITAATVLRDEKGQFVATATFFEALKKGEAAVRVVGVYGKSGLTATRAELRPAPAKPEAAQPEGSEKPAADAAVAAAKPEDAAKPDVKDAAAAKTPAEPKADETPLPDAKPEKAPVPEPPTNE